MNSISMMKMNELELLQSIRIMLHKKPSLLRKRIEDAAKKKKPKSSEHNPKLTPILLRARFQCYQRLRLIKLLAGCLMMRQSDNNV